MDERRFLIRLTNPAALRPDHQPELLTRVRAAAQPLNGRATNLRISSRAIEFDLFLSQPEVPDSFFAAWESLGSRLTCRPLGLPEPPLNAELLVQEARDYFNEERFWEVHEALEGLWKASQGVEKRWVQGVILLAAALVHQQKNELSVVSSLVHDGLSRLVDAPDIFHGWNLRQLRDHFSTQRGQVPLELPSRQ